VLTRGRFGTFTRVTASPERAPAPSPASQKPTVSILRPVMALVVAGIAVGTLLLWVLDPSADDGAAPFVAMAGVPMLVSALTVQLVVGHLVAGRRLRLTFLWWLFAVLPLALLVAAVPAVLADPDYFGSSTVGGTLGVLGMLAVLVLLGYGFGALLWFFVVMPLAHLGRSVVLLVRGEHPSAAAFVMPLVLLSLAAVILLGSGALDLSDTLPGRPRDPGRLPRRVGGRPVGRPGTGRRDRAGLRRPVVARSRGAATGSRARRPLRARRARPPRRLATARPAPSGRTRQR
jgi:hypothetical protein